MTLPSQNDREDVLASILCLTLLCPNDREDALASSLEHVHRLVGLYHGVLDTAMVETAAYCLEVV